MCFQAVHELLTNYWDTIILLLFFLQRTEVASRSATNLLSVHSAYFAMRQDLVLVYVDSLDLRINITFVSGFPWHNLLLCNSSVLSRFENGNSFNYLEFFSTRFLNYTSFSHIRCGTKFRT